MEKPPRVLIEDDSEEDAADAVRPRRLHASLTRVESNHGKREVVLYSPAIP